MKAAKRDLRSFAIRARRALALAWLGVADVLFDSRCVAGEHPLGRVRGPACAACEERLAHAARAPRCPECSASVNSGTCGSCAGSPRRVVVHAPLPHAGEARAIILAMKARRREDAAAVLARVLWADPQVRLALAEAGVVVPAPADPVRRRERGFDPAAAIAGEIARLESRSRGGRGRLRARAVLATRPGGKQSSRSPSQRRLALAGRISLRLGGARHVRDRHVVLVDDVVTTGATATACAGVLLRAGAARVVVIACTRAGGTILDAPAVTRKRRPS